MNRRPSARYLRAPGFITGVVIERSDWTHD